MKLFHKQSRPVPTLPAVNLLSPATFEVIATRLLRRQFAFACLVLVFVIAAGWSVQHFRVLNAQEALVVEQGESVGLATETQALTPVKTYVASVLQQQLTVQETMAREVYFSDILRALEDATPPEADLGSAEVTLNPVAPVAPPASPPATGEDAPAPAPVLELPSLCPGPDPFNTRLVVGCVLLSGSAENRAAVGDLVIQLGENELFVEPFISATTTADGERVTYTGSVGLSEEAYSNRYAELGAPAEEGAPS
jgi:hypothetical protein